jgi:RNA polymerase sigma-B factor
VNDRLSPEAIDDLFHEYERTGRRGARNQLVDAHMGFAHHIAKRYANRGIPLEDLSQIALLALVKAVDRFDPDHGAAFTSFAGSTIEGELKRHFRDAAWSVRVPRSTKNLHLLVRRANDELNQNLGRSPTVKEIAKHLDESVDSIVEALSASAAFNASSLDHGPTDNSDSSALTQDRSPRLSEVDSVLEGAVDRVLVDRLIDSLPEREREIVRLRFYGELSQSDIAARVGVSQMHVSRLLRRSFALMRQTAEG